MQKQTNKRTGMKATKKLRDKETNKNKHNIKINNNITRRRQKPAQNQTGFVGTLNSIGIGLLDQCSETERLISNFCLSVAVADLTVRYTNMLLGC